MIGYWWSVITSSGREFWVKGGSFFEGAARDEANERLGSEEFIVSWQRKEAIHR